MTGALTLYHAPPSTCAQKVRLVLAEKGLVYQSQLIDLFAGGQHDPDYVRLNPNHVVPTLVHDGRPIIESLLICEYLEDAFPEIPLMPQDAAGRHAVRLWTQYIDRVHAHAAVLTFAVGPRKMIVSQGQAAIEANIASVHGKKGQATRRIALEQGVASPLFGEALAAFVAMLDRMEDALQSAPWLANDSFSLADTAALPYVLRLDHLSMTPLIEARPKVADWLARIAARSSYGSAITDFLVPQLVAMLRANGAEVWPEIDALTKAA
jgi:glutathione S-transferase